MRSVRSFVVSLLMFALLFASTGCKKKAREQLHVPKQGLVDAASFPGDAASKQKTVVLGEPDAPGLIFLSSLNGYTEPCGCTEDIVYGGIDRLVGTSHALQQSQQSPLVLISAGDTLFESVEVQDADKAQDTLRIALLASALHKAKLRVMGVGPRDLSRGWGVLDDFARDAELTLVSTNMRPIAPQGDEAISLERAAVIRVGALRVALLNIVLADSNDLREDIVVQDPQESLNQALQQADVAGADLRVLFLHGATEQAAAFASEQQAINIVMTTQNDEQRDSIGTWGHSAQLQLWSQGRELGVLRLVKDTDSDADDDWQQMGELSRDEYDTLTQLIDRLSKQIQELEDRMEEGDRSPMLAKLRIRKAEYQYKIQQAQKEAKEDAKNAGPHYLWNVFALAPTLPQDADIHQERLQYNRALQALNLEVATPPPAAKEGEAHFVGAQSCQGCHTSSHAAWSETAHAHAYASLANKDKAFDLSCIGCHVTGYQQPGGSSLGFTDKLENVQCESCHGPGSEHVQNPTLVNKKAGIQLDVPEATCRGCHTPEHSPQFNDERYRARILVPGHGIRN